MINFITQVFTQRLKSAKHPRIFASTLDAAVFAKSARNSAERMGKNRQAREVWGTAAEAKRVELLRLHDAGLLAATGWTNNGL